ncbi:MAG TPA: S8 family serine peptidase, partial [Gammaproteobacteria bacterium]|nr:S8 family serine peptidase [Gammaproteobacteria bacterium]
MKLRLLWMCLVTLAVGACAQLPSDGSRSSRLEDAAARQLLVTTRQNTGRARSPLGDPASFYLRRRGYGPTPAVDKTLDRIASDYDIRRVSGWYISSIGEYCEVYELRSDQSLDDLVARIAADPGVELVQVMNVFRTQGVHYDDPLASMQPALNALSIASAHEHATGRGVTIAIVDSTVDGRHLELRGKVQSWRNLIDNRAIRRAEVHGTAVAGIIGSAANNGEGIVGIAPDSRIASLRACRTLDARTGRA